MSLNIKGLLGSVFRRIGHGGASLFANEGDENGLKMSESEIAVDDVGR
jgi:hypothetical protein